jgi:hypothetical protein
LQDYHDNEKQLNAGSMHAKAAKVGFVRQAKHMGIQT